MSKFDAFLTTLVPDTKIVAQQLKKVLLNLDWEVTLEYLTPKSEGTLCYSLDGEAFSPEIPTGTDAGDYIVYYRAAGEEAAQVSSLTVTSSKADVIFTAPSAVE